MNAVSSFSTGASKHGRRADVYKRQPQRAGGGQNDEHHGGENADICKADSVLLHAVQHAGNTDEVACFVIIIFIAAQKL